MDNNCKPERGLADSDLHFPPMPNPWVPIDKRTPETDATIVPYLPRQNERMIKAIKEALRKRDLEGGFREDASDTTP